jgi:hypothetical protein
MSETSEYIGTAWLEDDGTISLRLRAQTNNGELNVVGIGMLSYPKHHPQYQSILEHIGPIQPGEQVNVRPWPDE